MTIEVEVFADSLELVFQAVDGYKKILDLELWVRVKFGLQKFGVENLGWIT